MPHNLLMHISTANVGFGIGWRPAAEEIKKRLSYFDGRKIIAVASGGGCDPGRHVHDFFTGCDVELLDIENDRILREVVSHELLWSKVMTDDPAHVTFYCHSKGVTRPPRSTVQRWTKMLFEMDLDFLPLAEKLLETYPIVGSMLKRCPMLGQKWHYSGSFYWIKNCELNKRDWRKIDQKRYGVESWPALTFREEEAGVIFGDWGSQANPYNPVVLKNIERDYAEWSRENQQWKVS